MLLNWARNRMNGPRFLPSGRRLGPYFWSRVEASAAVETFLDAGREPFQHLVDSNGVPGRGAGRDLGSLLRPSSCSLGLIHPRNELVLRHEGR